MYFPHLIFHLNQQRKNYRYKSSADTSQNFAIFLTSLSYPTVFSHDWSKLSVIFRPTRPSNKEKKKEKEGERETWRQLAEVNWRIVQTRELIPHASSLPRLLLRHDIKFSYFGLMRAVCQDHSIRCWYRSLYIFLFLSVYFLVLLSERGREAPSVARKVLADSRVGGAGSGNRRETRGLLRVSLESCTVGWYRLSRTCFYLSKRWIDPLKDAGVVRGR